MSAYNFLTSECKKIINFFDTIFGSFISAVVGGLQMRRSELWGECGLRYVSVVRKKCICKQGCALRTCVSESCGGLRYIFANIYCANNSPGARRARASSM